MITTGWRKKGVRKFPSTVVLQNAPKLLVMQDGIHPHCTVEVFVSLQATFRNQIIALDTLAFTGHSIEWPPHSRDLNPCD